MPDQITCIRPHPTLPSSRVYSRAGRGLLPCRCGRSKLCDGSGWLCRQVATALGRSPLLICVVGGDGLCQNSLSREDGLWRSFPQSLHPSPLAQPLKRRLSLNHGVSRQCLLSTHCGHSVAPRTCADGHANKFGRTHFKRSRLIKHVSDPRGQICVAERFRDELHARIQAAVVNDSIAGIAGCEQGL